MPLDAQLPHTPAHTISAPAPAPQPLLSALTRWWDAAVQENAEHELGYESALPWVLTEPAQSDVRPTA